MDDRLYATSGTSPISVATINGIAVHLSFAPEQNTEVSVIVQNILKGAYLQRHSA